MTTPAPTRERNFAKIFVLTIGLLLGAAAVTVAISVIRSRSPAPAVRGHVVVAEVGRRDEVRVTFDVEKPPLATAECDITAFNQRGSSVGRLVGVTIGPSADGERLTRATVTVPTPLGQGSSAQVAVCRLVRGQ